MNPEELISASPFEQAAESYDSEFTNSSIGLLQRRRVYHFLENILAGSTSMKILEINCGTGEDAIWLAKKGHEVVATDASARMIDAACNKLYVEEKKINVSFHVTPFRNILNDFKGQHFDIVFSDFGGLNCISQESLEKLADEIYHLLNPGGKFIAVLMGRKCIWEAGYFMIKGKWKQVFRRLDRNGVQAAIGSSFQHTWYFSPADIRNLFKKEMAQVMLKPIGFALPPSYLENFFHQRPNLLSFLNGLEQRLDFSTLADFADHFFMVLERKKQEI